MRINKRDQVFTEDNRPLGTANRLYHQTTIKRGEKYGQRSQKQKECQEEATKNSEGKETSEKRQEKQEE